MSVLGPVSADHLGKVLMHEHIRIMIPGSELDPRSHQSRREIVHRATDRLAELRDHGVRTLVDPCPIELGRDVELMAEVSERSRVNIVCATGFYHEENAIGIPYYWRMRWPEEISELYLREISDGIGTTGIRPGIIKAATSETVGRHERKVLKAAGMTAERSGLPIITHTTNSQCGNAQQDLLAEGGADLNRCMIGHMDEVTAPTELANLTQRGSFVGIDRIGYETHVSDQHRADLIAGAIKNGLADRICLSQDHICAAHAGRPGYWVSPKEDADSRRAREQRILAQQNRRSSAHIFTSFVPQLIECGVSSAAIDHIFINNPRRLLCGD